jgi:hypothetical protein
MLGAGSGPTRWVVALEFLPVTTRTTTRSAKTSATLSRRKRVAIKATARTQPNQNTGISVRTTEFLGKLGWFVTSIEDKEWSVSRIRMGKRNKRVLATEQRADLLSSHKIGGFVRVDTAHIEGSSPAIASET